MTGRRHVRRVTGQYFGTGQNVTDIPTRGKSVAQLQHPDPGIPREQNRDGQDQEDQGQQNRDFSFN